MELNFQLTADDYRQAFYAHRARSLATRWFWRLSYVVLAFILAAPFFKTNRELKDILPPLVLAAGFLFIIVYLPHRVGKKMLAGKGMASPRIVEISDDGIHSRTDVSDSTLRWDSIANWIENRRVFVLYLSPVSFFPIPKRAMSAVQEDDLRALLRRHVRR